MAFVFAAFAVATAVGLPIVAIDAGHGGDALGTVGVCGAKEKDVALAVAKELAALLDASGTAHAVLIRSDDRDVPLEERARAAGRTRASLFVSIHGNASPKSDNNGIETYFLSRRAADQRTLAVAQRENGVSESLAMRTDASLQALLRALSIGAAHAESQRLALRVQNALAGQLARRGRGVLQAPFLVLLYADMPAVLAEIGFLSNPEECRLLASVDYQRRVAAALGTAVLLHFDAEPTLALLPPERRSRRR